MENAIVLARGHGNRRDYRYCDEYKQVALNGWCARYAQIGLRADADLFVDIHSAAQLPNL